MSQQNSGKPLVVRVTDVDSERNPDLDKVASAILKDGKRSLKEAKYITVVNRHTGEIHHHALTIVTYQKHKQNPFRKPIPKHSVGLVDNDGDEIERLLNFLQSIHKPTTLTETDFAVVTVPLEGSVDPTQLQSLINKTSTEGKVETLLQILDLAEKDKDIFDTLLERIKQQPALFADAAATINLARYRAAFTQLQTLISKRSVLESEFQELLTENPWMFGSEYSELLPRRNWTRDSKQDFVQRRTTDGFIEIVEIKTPLNGTPLFNVDKSHDSLYAGAELSKVVGQVQKYLEEMDSEHNTILAKDNEDTAKIRAKIIIGRDIDEYQRKALRRLNGHLHRIEIITFDQLLRIAQRVLSYLEGIITPIQTS